jgi:hypothetical protein
MLEPSMLRANFGLALLPTFLSAGLAWGLPAAKGPSALKPLPSQHAPSLPAIDADSSLGYDNGDPDFYWALPDLFDDHYFNVRFSPGDSCKLLQAAFLFMQNPGDTISTLPNVHVLIWPSNGLLPNGLPTSALDSVIIDDDDLVVCPNDTTWDTMYVDLEGLDLHFGAAQAFHIGWEPDSTDSTDGPLCILSDGASPETNHSCEWWGGDPDSASWGTVMGNWGVGFNFMIRAWVELFDVVGTRMWLDPNLPDDFALRGPYPNPFNPQTSMQIDLPRAQEVSLEVYDLTGRLADQILKAMLPAGRSIITWQPRNLSSGHYLIVLRSKSQTVSTQAILVK